MNGRILFVLTTLTAFSLPASLVYGQRGGFSPDGFFDRLDQDGSGVIEPNEIEESRFARSFVERMEIDTRRGISREQFRDVMDQARQRFEESRGGRSWGGGDRDQGQGDEDRRDRWRSRDREDNRKSPSDYGRSTGSPNRSDSTPRPATTPAAPPQRVTIDLQQEFTEGDSDGDGQIGLYEWTRWKSRAALAQFFGMDRNGDGFLTPRELTHVEEAQPVDLASALPIAPEAAPGTPESTVSQPVPSADSAATLSTEVAKLDSEILIEAIVAADPAQVKQAKRFFTLLDKNRDGEVTELEWANSRRLKPRFEDAGVDLTQPMTAEQFVSIYIRLFASGRTGD